MPDRRVRKVLDILERQSHRRLRLHDLATAVHIGPSRLEHLFKAEAKTSIRDFIRTVRLKRAADLIASTDERISQICYSVGFNDLSNFDRVFRKHYGVSPRAYRARAESDEASG